MVWPETNMTYITKINTKIGPVTLASDGTNLIGLWIDGQKYYASNIKETVVKNNLPIFKDTIKWLNEYFEGKEPKTTLKLKLEGSNFRKDVWNILLTIPYGSVITYGDIAKKLEQKYKRKMSAQAVGGAVGHNPISIIVPCHRVVGTNGNLTGYAGGIDKKIKLLKLENINFEKLFVPKKTQHYKNNKN